MFKKFSRGIKRAGRKITRPIDKVTSKIERTVAKIPVAGNVLLAANRIRRAPAILAIDVIKGKRVDRALAQNFKARVKDVKTVGPYAQSVVSFVPGIGQPLSAAMGAGLALADGKSLDDAMIAGIRGAVPGGPLAVAAFDVAAAAAQGKPLDEVAISALPIPPAQKKLVAGAMKVIKAAAEGENVSDAVYRAALKQLPPEIAKAVPAGVAVGQALVAQRGRLTAGDAVNLGRAASEHFGAPKIPPQAAKVLEKGHRAASQIERGVKSAKALRDVRKATQVAKRIAKQQARKSGPLNRAGRASRKKMNRRIKAARAKSMRQLPFMRGRR